MWRHDKHGHGSHLSAEHFHFYGVRRRTISVFLGGWDGENFPIINWVWNIFEISPIIVWNILLSFLPHFFGEDEPILTIRCFSNGLVQLQSLQVLPQSLAKKFPSDHHINEVSWISNQLQHPCDLQSSPWQWVRVWKNNILGIIWWLLTRCLCTTDSQRYAVGRWDPLLLLFTTTGVLCFLSEPVGLEGDFFLNIKQQEDDYIVTSYFWICFKTSNF